MIESHEKICQAALALPEEQREALFVELAGSLVPEIGPGRGAEISAELSRRMAVPGLPFDSDWEERVVQLSDERRLARESHA